jgi:hypothetical protein
LSFLPFTMNNVASQIAATASSFVGALGWWIPLCCLQFGNLEVEGTAA